MVSHLFNTAVATIFAREFLEGSIIIGEYRTIILRGNALAPDVRREEALLAVTVAALAAAACALLVIAAVAIPLGVMSKSFDDTTATIIEGVSKLVASLAMLFLSLKLPKWLGVYARRKKSQVGVLVSTGPEDLPPPTPDTALTLRSIRFNVAWNIWREVAECGVFLIPSFLAGQGLQAIPLSALIGAIIGSSIGLLVYIANARFRNKQALALFIGSLLVFFSAGLMVGALHEFEEVLGETKDVWYLPGPFWDANAFPMTILKPLGYSNPRTVLQLTSYWSWLILAVLLHVRKYRLTIRALRSNTSTTAGRENGAGGGISNDGSAVGSLQDQAPEHDVEMVEEEGLAAPNDRRSSSWRDETATLSTSNSLTVHSDSSTVAVLRIHDAEDSRKQKDEEEKTMEVVDLSHV